MALTTAIKSKLTFTLARCSGPALKSVAFMSSKPDKPVVKSVFVSQSRDVFTNLALEDWLCHNMDFSHHHVMLLWRNDPCVVIGRNQNPWLETDCDKLAKNKVTLARRKSGGGTVYHDPGNLNITFFAPRERYNRRQNLEVISQTLEREWNLHPEINKKEDIVLDGNCKISGTASMIGRSNTYHHCTLLVDVDKDQLKSSLLKNESISISTNATNSVPSPTVNLGELHSGITMEALMSAIGWQFLRISPQTKQDHGWSHVQRQNGFQMINPSEEWFPGIQKIRDEFSNWDWKFGKTPMFQVARSYDVGFGAEALMTVTVHVEKGRVGDVIMSLPNGVAWGDCSGPSIPITVPTVAGSPFSPTVFHSLEKAIKLQTMQFSQDEVRRKARV